MLTDRIFARDGEGNVIEDAEGLFSRVAHALADNEKEEQDFYDVMSSLKFLPNSPALVNAGRPLGQLAACFVVPVTDSLAGIMDTAKTAALIHQSGGGTGFDWSPLRENGSTVTSSGNVATGPIGFMGIVDYVTNVVKQGGVRRGANMGILRVDHPDILDFIQAKMYKEDGTRDLTNFNISVAITDAFLEALRNDGEYELVSPRGYTVRKQAASEVWRRIAECAWATGDPGLFFVDETNRHDPVPGLGRITATNPCGEVPLRNNETCNLGSIDLAKFVVGRGYDFTELERVIRIAVRLLDNIVSKNNYPTEEIAQTTRASRKIGLGWMGFADSLIKMGVMYDSVHALRIAQQVTKFLTEVAFDESSKLGVEKGNFPAWEVSVYATTGTPMRNSTRTVMAPTGTISRIANTSSGIEPLFAVEYDSNIIDKVLHSVHPLLGKAASELFRTAGDISPEWHVRMQAAFQDFTDDSISKTINMPHETTVEDVMDAYDLAVELGVKGLTVFRDGCLTEQVLVEELSPCCEAKLIPQGGCMVCTSCQAEMCSAV